MILLSSFFQGCSPTSICNAWKAAEYEDQQSSFHKEKQQLAMQMTPLAGAPGKRTKSSEQDLGHITDVSPVLQEHPDNIHVYGLVVHPSAHIVIYSI